MPWMSLFAQSCESHLMPVLEICEFMRRVRIASNRGAAVPKSDLARLLSRPIVGI